MADKKEMGWFEHEGENYYFKDLELRETMPRKADKATTLSGYGITDAKIEEGTITLGDKTITPITSHQDITGKVDKVTGKGLSSNDFTNDYKTRLDNIGDLNQLETSAKGSLVDAINEAAQSGGGIQFDNVDDDGYLVI